MSPDIQTLQQGFSTMLEEIKTLHSQYLIWLKDKTVFREIKDHVEITTPFLDRHNDYLQIYIKPENGGYVLTDDGYTIQDLEISGCDLDSPKRQTVLKMTLAGFGIENLHNSLTARATSSNFALKKHNLIQAILAVNDLFHLARPHVNSFFFEDVSAWLDLSDIRYTPGAKFTGKANYDHLFDFVIPKSKIAPERILKVLNNPTKETAESMVFAWIDTKDVRPANSQAYAILNDGERKIGSKVFDALNSYDISPILWSEKEQIKETLAA
jgi:hypothetical protein